MYSQMSFPEARMLLDVKHFVLIAGGGRLWSFINRKAVACKWIRGLVNPFCIDARCKMHIFKRSSIFYILLPVFLHLLVAF